MEYARKTRSFEVGPTAYERNGNAMSKKRMIILIIAAFCVNPACGEKSTEPEPFPRTLMLDYGAVWSEAHDLIAYFHNRIPESDDPDSSGIYVIRPDGTEKRLIYKSIFIFGLDWSNDGNWIITDSGNMLVKISYPGEVADTLTGTGKYFFPVWSPNGQNILYMIHAGDDRGVYLIDSNGNNNRLVIPYGMNADWPYIDSLLYLNFDSDFTVGSLYLADTADFYRREFYPNDTRFVKGTVKPKMDVNSARVVFHAQMPGEPESLWKLENGFVHAVRMKSFANYPNLSPNGEMIIFTDTHEDNGRLWIMNWDGTELRQLTY